METVDWTLGYACKQCDRRMMCNPFYAGEGDGRQHRDPVWILTDPVLPVAP
ncbi:predicted protein [Sclerotinia sclerotiorum 1980 UF-70]|uniref:Uncharacterized protein n=1 Tax=Sclerotinia sclerotiorum (strain ATCC 18683 / 1980 / Ss-1) TaxID=665079 RepID=A7EF74_SCLS1|nr:predicted protein [Sclerotinia sclerotiorum 1980 UF-70]EDO01490.1 predicted protein [Sclerotinia sclerotiorum 1980 UF-70]